MILLRPVVDTLLKTYSDVIIWMVTDQKNESLFNHDPRIKFIGVDLNNNILQILRQIKTASNLTYFNGIYDLHNVIRSQFIRFFLKNKTHKIAFLEGNGELLASEVYDVTESVMQDNYKLSYHYSIDRFNFV